jgi:peroxiredoxin
MRSLYSLTLCLCVATAAVELRAGDAAASNIGNKITPVTLKDGAGKSLAVGEAKGKPTVVFFLSFDCPVSTSYSEPLAELAKRYGDRVNFLAVCTNEDKTPREISKLAQEYQLPFPVVQDQRLAAADAFHAATVPEAFLLDAQGVLRYRGRIDNSYSARLKRNAQTTKHDLRQALDEVLAGKPVSQPVTQVVGCPIPRESAKTATAAVTYYHDVLPLLQENCQQCHRAGEVGPFALTTYRDAVNWASDIKDYTQSRKMPPWKPNEGVKFHNERRLSDKDLSTLAAWVDGGTPAGNPNDAPPPKQFTAGWQLGQPDLILTVGDEMQVGPTGRDLFRCFVLPTNLTEDKFVTAVEVRPGNPRVVHHALLFIDATAQGRKLEAKEKAKPADEKSLDRGPGYSVSMGVGFLPQGGLGGWAPGQIGRYLPENTGYHLPKGADVVAQIHYHRDGKLEKDRTQIGLYFAKTPISKRFQGLVIPGRFLFIPSGNDHFKVDNTTPPVTQDCVLHSVMPHMHMLGREIKVTIIPPDGPKQSLIAINDWDYSWQETYFLEKPIAIKAGTRFQVEARYDNSVNNPNNPSSPPRLVKFGEQTTDEMCFVFLGLTSDKPGRIRYEAARRDAPKPP